MGAGTCCEKREILPSSWPHPRAFRKRRWQMKTGIHPAWASYTHKHTQREQDIDLWSMNERKLIANFKFRPNYDARQALLLIRSP